MQKSLSGVTFLQNHDRLKGPTSQGSVSSPGSHIGHTHDTHDADQMPLANSQAVLQSALLSTITLEAFILLQCRVMSASLDAALAQKRLPLGTKGQQDPCWHMDTAPTIASTSA